VAGNDASPLFSPAPAVAQIAERLIALHHPDLLKHEVRIEYVFRSDTVKSKGREQWGQCRKESSLAAFYGKQAENEVLKPFFAIVISQPKWCSLEPEQRAALVDHELSHCGCRLDGDGNVQLYIVPHDLEEFRGVVERHGMWRRDVKLMQRSFEAAPQTVLRLDE
jgi:hypothetical protein